VVGEGRMVVLVYEKIEIGDCATPAALLKLLNFSYTVYRFIIILKCIVLNLHRY